MPENYTSYDYGAAIRETRQLDPKYTEDKLIGYLTQSVAPLTKTDRDPSDRAGQPARHRHGADEPGHRHAVPRRCGTATRRRRRSTRRTSRSTSTPRRGGPTYTYDDVDPALHVRGHVVARRRDQSYTERRLQAAPSRSPASPATSVTVPFTGTAIQWIGPRSRSNHGIRRRLPRRRQGADRRHLGQRLPGRLLHRRPGSPTARTR